MSGVGQMRAILTAIIVLVLARLADCTAEACPANSRACTPDYATAECRAIHNACLNKLTMQSEISTECCYYLKDGGALYTGGNVGALFISSSTATPACCSGTLASNYSTANNKIVRKIRRRGSNSGDENSGDENFWDENSSDTESSDSGCIGESTVCNERKITEIIRAGSDGGMRIMLHPFAKSNIQRVLCTTTTAGKLCATPNHIVVRSGEEVTMDELCQSINCTATEERVTNFWHAMYDTRISCGDIEITQKVSTRLHNIVRKYGWLGTRAWFMTRLLHL